MAKYGVTMKNGDSYEVDANNGDEAKRRAYDLAVQKHPELARPDLAGDPRRSVERVEHPEPAGDQAATEDRPEPNGRQKRGR